VYVGLAKLHLVIAASHSLKEKRMVIRRIKDRVRDKLGVVVNEVGEPEVRDSWQRAELGVAVVSGDRAKALDKIDAVIRVIAGSGADVVAIAKDTWTYDTAPAPVAAVDDRTGTGDKAIAGDDWVPDEWRDEVSS
jgi:uncharacterized protein YlxP (DUF503 family)